MSEIIKVSPTKLKEHEKASALIPEMSDKEWDDFFENVQQVGIRQPLDINTKYEVLDGRHRLKAAKRLGLNKIEVRQHDLTEDEEMKFVRDTAIERRSLTPEQKLNIILNTEDLIKDIYEKGKKAKIEGSKKGASITNKTALGSIEPKAKKSDSNTKIGEMAGLSKSQVVRAKKIKRENPDLYKEVVEGKKAISTAYNELPTVKTDHLNKKKLERSDANVKQEIEFEKPNPKQFNQKPPELTKEEIESEMFDANVSTFFRHLQEIEGFIGRTDKFEEVVAEAVKRDSASMHDYRVALEKIINLLKTEVITNV